MNEFGIDFGVLGTLGATGTVIGLSKALAGFGAAVAFLAYLDKRAGGPAFADWLAKPDVPGAIYRGCRIVAICLLIGMIVGCTPASATMMTDKYDSHIRNASKTYLPGLDWRLWKAQLYQESLLDPSATSPVGAQGLAQIMPGTWPEIAKALGYGDAASPYMVEPAVTGGAYYMARMRSVWKSPRPEADRHSLAMASYNAGAGNLIKAQREAGMSSRYRDIIAALPKVTGHHAKETTTYVRRIWGYYVMMVTGL